MADHAAPQCDDVDVKPKVQRAKEFSIKEDHAIIKGHAKYRDILETTLNYNKKVTLKDKHAKWALITADANAIGNAVRTIDQVKSRFSNMIKLYKAQKKSTSQTGGGNALEYKPFMKLIDDYKGEDPEVVGINGGGNGKQYNDPFLTSASVNNDYDEFNNTAMVHEQSDLTRGISPFDDSPNFGTGIIGKAKENENYANNNGMVSNSSAKRNIRSESRMADTNASELGGGKKVRGDCNGTDMTKTKQEKVTDRKMKSVTDAVGEKTQLSIEILEMDKIAAALRVENERKRSTWIDMEIDNAKLASRKLKVQGSFWKLAFDDKVRERVAAASNGELEYVLYDENEHAGHAQESATQ